MLSSRGRGLLEGMRGCVGYMGLYAGEPLRAFPFCMRCCSCWFCIWLNSKDVGVGVCMKAMVGSPAGLKAPLSVLGKGWTSLSQLGILMSTRICSNPSALTMCH